MEFIISNTPIVLNFFLPFLIGSLIFFSIIIAPNIFRHLDEKNARILIRAIFPKIYSWAFIITLLLTIVTAFYDLFYCFILFVISFGYFFSKKYMVGWLNSISDIEKKTEKQKKRFTLLHSLSVFIFTCQIIGLLVLNYYI